MNERTQELLNQLTPFQNGKSKAGELLNDGFTLLNQMGDIAKPLGFEIVRPVRLMELLKWLSKVNQENQYGADKLIESFVPMCKQFNNDIIQRQLSGKEGENKAYKSLQTMKKKHRILRNVELKNGEHRTELDFVVITNSVVFILEVKNTGKDTVIDEKGNYCRITKMGELAFEKNIGEQMNEKEYLLREILKNAGMEKIDIRSLVVFTNSGITVTNNYEYITECYLSQLPHIVDDTEGNTLISDLQMVKIVQSIMDSQSSEEYYVEMDIELFKKTFVEIIVVMEQARDNKRTSCKKQNVFSLFFRKLAKVACFVFN